MAHEGARAQLSDTTPRAKQRYFERLRATPPHERLARALRLSEQVREATMADVRRQNPSATEEEIAVAFVRRVYGDKLANQSANRWLDLEYLRRWSKDQGTLDLLERVLGEASTVG